MLACVVVVVKVEVVVAEDVVARVVVDVVVVVELEPPGPGFPTPRLYKGVEYTNPVVPLATVVVWATVNIASVALAGIGG